MNRLKQLRMQKELTQEQLRDKLGLKKWDLPRMEQGRRTNREQIVADYFGVTVDELYEKVDTICKMNPSDIYAGYDPEDGKYYYKSREFCERKQISPDSVPYMIAHGLKVKSHHNWNYIADEDYAEYIKHHRPPARVTPDFLLPIVIPESRSIFYPAEQIADDFGIKLENLLAMKDRIRHIERNGRTYMAREGIDRILSKCSVSNTDLLDVFMNKLKA